jgi:hypothetical protein
MTAARGDLTPEVPGLGKKVERKPPERTTEQKRVPGTDPAHHIETDEQGRWVTNLPNSGIVKP